MILSIIFLVIGFILLVKCADMFVEGASRLAHALGVSTIIIGLTIVAFGTSAPEAAVSVIASLTGKNTISVGNVVGSNICNLLLVLGTSALFGKLTTRKKVVVRDYAFSLFSYLVIFILTAGFFISGAKEGVITRTNGLILLCFLILYLYSLLLESKNKKDEDEPTKFQFKDILCIIFGIAGIVVGGQLVVSSATNIASLLGVSDNVIALTIVAIGTSLPELVTSVIAVKKGECDIAIGNVIGSNIFNIFFILGISSVVKPLTIGLESFIDICIMAVVGIIVFFFINKNYRIGNKKGPIMIIMYIMYMIYILVR